MAIAPAVEQFLRAHELHYDLVSHPHTVSASRTAEVSHVPGDQLAKSVLLQDESGYVVAVLPSTRRLDLGKLRHHLNRMMKIAVENEVEDLFRDCDPGAIPAIAKAYDVETIVDDTLLQQPDIYFESGDHEALVHMSGRDFRALMADLPHGRFTYKV